MIQYVFQIKTLSRDTPSFQRQKIITKYRKREWDGLRSIKWMRWKWMTKCMKWTLIVFLSPVFSCEFWEISKNTFSSRTPPVAASDQIIFLQYLALLNKSYHISSTYHFRLFIICPEVKNKSYHILSIYNFVFLTIPRDFAL